MAHKYNHVRYLKKRMKIEELKNQKQETHSIVSFVDWLISGFFSSYSKFIVDIVFLIPND